MESTMSHARNNRKNRRLGSILHAQSQTKRRKIWRPCEQPAKTLTAAVYRPTGLDASQKLRIGRGTEAVSDLRIMVPVGVRISTPYGKRLEH